MSNNKMAVGATALALSFRRSNSTVGPMMDHENGDGEMDHKNGDGEIPRVVALARSPRPKKMVRILRTVFSACQLSLPCRVGRPPGLPTLGTKVIGTLFGYRNRHARFAVQESPKTPPFMQIQLAMPTHSLVREMASGLVRIALECEKNASSRRGKLIEEPVWSMHCNGRNSGYAMKKNCTETDIKILGMVEAVSMGAGVLPTDNDEGPDGELMYMRARFDRVVCSKDSEAFYMMNPDGTGGPELSIFLLRI